MNLYLPTIAAILLALSPGSAYTQDNQLMMFAELTDREWVGHYADSDDSSIVHNVSWEFRLDSLAVVQRKDVPEVGFSMEVYYYMDWEEGGISFLSLMNKEIISKGRVEQVDGMIVAQGTSYSENGARNFRTTYEIDENGRLIDRFYRGQKDQWVQGHLIIYDQVRQ